MTWFKADDGLHNHRKVRKLGRDMLPAIGLWTLAGTWCADVEDAEGFIECKEVRRFDARLRYARLLVRVGLWHEIKAHDTAVDCATCVLPRERPAEDGYLFHDWSDFQPSAEENRAARAKKSSAGTLGNHRRWHVDRGVVDPRCTYCTHHGTDRTSDRGGDRSPDGTSDRRTDRKPVANEIAKTSPDPTRYKNPPSPPIAPSPLAGLGLTAREIEITQEAIMLAMPDTRDPDAVIRTMIRNGTIGRYVDQARAYLADDVPRYPGPAHPRRPDDYGELCLDCPMPKDHPCHGGDAT